MEYKVTGVLQRVRVEGKTTQYYVCWKCGKGDAADVVIGTTGTCIGPASGELPDAMFARALAATINQTGS
jgi:hypothetical protein